MTSPFRRGRPEDAPHLAQFVNMAGEGLPLYLWTKIAGPGESPWDIGQQRARRDSGSFSYRNAIVREDAGKVAACLVGYALPDAPEAVNYDDMPAMFVPLQELENLAPKTWYVNVLAAYPEHRGKGFGTELLSVAEELAADLHCVGTSIIVSDSNTRARSLYEKLGYVQHATRAMVKDTWDNPGSNWILLVK